MSRDERAGWICGMIVGLIFGLLCIQVSSISWFAAIMVVVAWLYVMLAYMKIGVEDKALDDYDDLQRDMYIDAVSEWDSAD